MSIKIFFGTVLLFLLAAVAAGGDNVKFDYLKVKGNTVKTTHQARYQIKIGKSFKSLGEFHHQPIYEGKQFNVSLAAFSKGENVILVHAETLTDGSGGLDYSKLKADSLNELKFTSREQCAPAEAAADLSANAEIKFLREKGFPVTLPFYLKQYLATNADGTAEVVVSYGRHVSACDSNTAEFGKEIARQVGENIKVSKIN